MPWEHIGECGGADGERERMIAEVKLGAAYVRLVCGEPPSGCKVGVMWHEHELGSYATVGLHWDPEETGDAPWEYIARADRALSRFDDAVNWTPMEPDEDEGEDGEGDDDPDALIGLRNRLVGKLPEACADAVDGEITLGPACLLRRVLPQSLFEGAV